MLIADRQGEAPDAVSGGKLALEVGGPQVVGRLGGRRHRPRVLSGPSSPPLLHQPFPGQQIARRADRRPRRDPRVTGRQPRQQLPGPPVGMPSPRPENQLGDRRLQAVGAVVRRMAAILQARPPLLGVSSKPLVARLSADAVSPTQLRHRQVTGSMIGDESLSLLHWCSLHPWHRPTSGLGVGPRYRGVSPINPVRSVTNQPGLYRGFRLTAGSVSNKARSPCGE